MLQEDKPFELIYDQTAGIHATDAGGVSAALFHGFVKQALMKRFSSFSEARPASRPPSSAPGAAVAPANSMCNVIVLDISSLIASKHYKKLAILHPDSLTLCLRREPDRRSPARRRMLTDLQDALLAADMVLVFNQADVMPLMALGAPLLRHIPLPALAPKHAAPPTYDLLIIDHSDDDTVAAALAAEIEADITGLTTQVWRQGSDSNGPAAALPCGADARIHLHIATASGQNTRFRVVDSLAQRKPVIQIGEEIFDAPAPDYPVPPSRIEHNHSGLSISRVQGVVPAVRALLHDPAMADLFTRNGHRIAANYNSAVEALMLGTLA